LNAKLAALNIGITIDDGDGPLVSQTGWEIERNDDGMLMERTRVSYFLGYAKLQEQWQLVIVKCDERQEYVDPGIPKRDRLGNDEIETYKIDFIPLLQSSRYLRMNALASVEELLTALKKKAEEDIKAIQEARAFADKL